jgi:glycosyltransferase involved in cell wall biosynthesis
VKALRILRVYHSGVVDEYRERERGLQALGHEVTLVCPPYWQEGGSRVHGSPAADLRVRVIPVRGREHPILFWYASRAFRQVVRELQPDIVDLHEEPYSLSVAAALHAVRRERPAAKVCLYSAQNILKRYPPPFRQLEAIALARAAACYPCSTEAGDVLRAKGYAGPLHVIPLGVSVPEAGHRHAPGPVVAGFLGRLEPYKGAQVALEAVARARAQGGDVRLEVLGSGPQEGELRALAARLGIEASVHFAGAVPQDEALRRISDLDVVLIPSLTMPGWKEQFGRVAAQAMAAGVPVLASASGSLPEVVGDARMLAAEGDDAAFAAKLLELAGSSALRAELGAQGRARARALFAWDSVAEDLDRMYRQVLAGDATDWSYVRAA